MPEDTDVISFKVPTQWKTALRMVAADQGKTISDLLRAAVRKTITTHRGGHFLSLTNQKNGQKNEAHQ